MGAEALSILAQHKLVPKGRSISSQRCAPIPLPSGAMALVSYSAAIQDVDYSKHIDMLTDCRAAMRLLATGQYAPVTGKYRYVNDFSDAVAYIKAQYAKTKKPVRITMDTETLGLDRYDLKGYIVSVQITYKKGQGDMIRFPDRASCLKISKALREQVNWLLTNEMVSLRGANFKYDINWMKNLWSVEDCTTFKFDTMLVGSLLDENRSNSLNVHAKVCTSMGGYDDAFNAKYDKSRMDLVPKDDLLLYGCGDTDACYQVAETMQAELREDPLLAKFYTTVLHPAARAYESVEQVGWCVDRDYYEFLRDELEFDIESMEKQGRELLGGRLVAKHMKEDGSLNLTKASLLKDFMFSPMGLNLRPKMKTEKTGEPSTALEHMLMFADNPIAAPFVNMLKEYNSATKTLGTYVINFDKNGAPKGGFLHFLRSDGRFHPTYYLFSGEQFDDEGGTVTGRLSVKDPAIQTIPKHTTWAKRLRKAFIAPPGMLVAAHDYSQGELRIAACLANEEVMIEAYRNGIDLHAITAAKFLGYTWDEFMEIKRLDPDQYDNLRFLGKAGNFGLIYGMQGNGFVNYSASSFGLDMSLNEAESHIEAFFDLYPALLPWHRKCKEIARKQKYIRSPLGRIRHLPLITSTDRFYSSKAERQAVNSPVQATLSDMSLWATGLMWQRGMLKKAPVFGMVHDQLLRYVPEDNYERYLREGRDIMENLPFKSMGWDPQLTFSVDSEIGPTLGDLQKVKLH